MVIKVQHFREKQMFDAKQMFDKDLKVTKQGKTFKMYDAIQEANVDTDIYEVARKYGMVGAEKECAEAYMKKNLIELDEGFQEFMDMRSVLDKKIQAENMWNNLPIEIKRQFNNDVNEFMDNGPDWIKQQVELENQRQTQQQIVSPEPTKKEEVKSNE